MRTTEKIAWAAVAWALATSAIGAGADRVYHVHVARQDPGAAMAQEVILTATCKADGKCELTEGAP